MRDIAELLASMLHANTEQIKQLPLADHVLGAVLECKQLHDRGLKSTALSRQKRYATRLLSESDISAVQSIVQSWRHHHMQQVHDFHKIEQWRDTLLINSNAIGDFLQVYPYADAEQLQELIRKAQHAAIDDKRHSRALFQFVQSVLAAPTREH